MVRVEERKRIQNRKQGKRKINDAELLSMFMIETKRNERIPVIFIFVWFNRLNLQSIGSYHKTYIFYL